MEKDEKIEYNNENKEPDMVKEEALAYGVKRQGEYTLEDYYALPEDVRVELIDGVIYDMAAPHFIHQRIGDLISHFLNVYILKKKGSCIPFNAPVDVQLDCDHKTMVEPDVGVICDRTKIINGRVFGAPDFVIEILSPSTSKKDTTIKLRKYKDAGVREYWMVDPDKQKIIVYDWDNSDNPKVYGFDAKVPVGIFGGECEIDFATIREQIAFLYEEK